MGYLAEAKEHVERTHRTPIPGMDESIGESDLRRVHSKIMNFLKMYGEPLDNGKPIVFTYTDKYSVNDNQVNVLKSFMRSFSDDGEVNIDIFPLEQLFITLRKALSEKEFDEPLPNDNFADVIMSRDPFDVVPGVGCQVCKVLEKWKVDREYIWKSIISVSPRCGSCTLLRFELHRTLGIHAGRQFL